MVHRTSGLKVLGLSLLAALSLMVFATGAHADGEFKIGGKTFGELKIEEESFTGSLSESFNFLVAAALPFQINCSKLAVSKGTLLLKGESHATFTLSECVAKEDKSPFSQISCTVAPIELAALGIVDSIGGTAYLLFTPSNGTSFGNVELSGGFCTLTGSYPLKGSFAAEAGGEAESVALAILTSKTEGPLGDGLTFGESKASLTGKMSVSLSGANKGKKLFVSPTLHQGEFKIKGQKFAELGIKEETISGSTKETFSFLIGSQNLEFNCGFTEISEAKILIEGHANLTLNLSSCTALVNSTKKELSVCEVKNITAKLKSSTLLHEEKVFLLFEPLVEGEPLTVISIAGALCTLPVKVTLTGTFAAEIGAEAVSQKLTLVNAETASIFGDGIKLGVNGVVAEGKIPMELSGKEAGNKWGAI
jgi:hypothetical protein